MIVVDTNVIAYLHLKGDRTAEAEGVLRKDAVWAVPRLWRSELQNVLAHYLRKQLLTLHDAILIADNASLLVMGREYDVPTLPVMRLVSSSDCSAYDCEFVALAQDLGVPLITADKAVLRAFPQTAVSPTDFTTDL